MPEILFHFVFSSKASFSDFHSLFPPGFQGMYTALSPPVFPYKL